MILVDTNVLLDVVLDDPTWADGSQRQLEMASLQGALVVNPVIYSELSMASARTRRCSACPFSPGTLAGKGLTCRP